MSQFIGCVWCGEAASSVDVISEEDGDQVTTGYCDEHVDAEGSVYKGRKLRPTTKAERTHPRAKGNEFGVFHEEATKRRANQTAVARAELVDDVAAAVVAKLEGTDTMPAEPRGTVVP